MRLAHLTRSHAVLLVIALGALTLATAAPPWVRAQTATAIDQSVAVVVNGGDAAPAVNAAGLVLVAAGLALALGGRGARRLVLVVIAAAGVLVAWSAIGVATSPEAAARAGAAETAGVTDLTGLVGVTAWPWACAGAGVLAVGAAVLAWAGARGWTVSPGRHERTSVRDSTAADGAGPQAGHQDAWDALTRGADPTSPGDR